jgi:hypothetical protein
MFLTHKHAVTPQFIMVNNHEIEVVESHKVIEANIGTQIVKVVDTTK